MSLTLLTTCQDFLIPNLPNNSVRQVQKNSLVHVPFEGPNLDNYVNCKVTLWAFTRGVQKISNP